MTARGSSSRLAPAVLGPSPSYAHGGTADTGNSGWFAQGEEDVTHAQGEQTRPKTPSPGAAQRHARAPGYAIQHISTALPRALRQRCLRPLKSGATCFPL